METTLAFILGVCAVIGVAVVTLVVVGMFKIHKLKQQYSYLSDDMSNTRRSYYESLDRTETSVFRRLDDMDRNTQLNLEQQNRDLISYIDSRIDKLQAKKEILKG